MRLRHAANSGGLLGAPGDLSGVSVAKGVVRSRGTGRARTRKDPPTRGGYTPQQRGSPPKSGISHKNPAKTRKPAKSCRGGIWMAAARRPPPATRALRVECSNSARPAPTLLSHFQSVRSEIICMTWRRKDFFLLLLPCSVRLDITTGERERSPTRSGTNDTGKANQRSPGMAGRML
jgi:hypothetical protein